MAIEIETQEQLEAFLRDKPIEWSRVIATRAALRVLPVALSSDMRGPHLSSVLRACFISWVAAKYPAHDMTSAARSADSAAFSAARSADSAAFSAARSADSAAFSAAGSAAGSAFSAAFSAARSAGSAADSAAGSAAGSAARSAAWKVVQEDLSATSKLFTAADVLNSLLWPYTKRTWSDGKWDDRQWNSDMPTWAAAEWQKFLHSNSARANGYAPWIDWYTAVLNGTDHFGPDLTLRIAQQPDEWWKRSAAEVNADVARWLAESPPDDGSSYAKKINEFDKKLMQRPAASSFGWVDGKLAADPPPAVPPGSLAQDFLDETRGKAAELRERLSRTNAAPRVHKTLEGLIAVLPDAAADLRPGLLRSRARSLHADATVYAGRFQEGELPVDAVAMLLDLSGNLRDLEGCFPQLQAIELQIVALNLKSADVVAVQEHLSVVNDVVAANDMVADSAKSVMAAGTETMKAEASPEIVEVRTAEQALTTRNLANAALQGSLQQILSRLPGTTGRVYDETEKAVLNVIRPVVSVGTSLAAGAGATVLFGGIFAPIFALAALGLTEYDRLPGVINFIKEASNFIKETNKASDSSDSEEK